jgi:hypothetical protein
MTKIFEKKYQKYLLYQKQYIKAAGLIYGATGRNNT